jgi:hypothetical protein
LFSKTQPSRPSIGVMMREDARPRRSAKAIVYWFFDTDCDD